MIEPHPSTVVPGTVEWDYHTSPGTWVTLRGWPYQPERRTARGVTTCPARPPRVEVHAGIGQSPATIIDPDGCDQLAHCVLAAGMWLRDEQRRADTLARLADPTHQWERDPDDDVWRWTDHRWDEVGVLTVDRYGEPDTVDVTWWEGEKPLPTGVTITAEEIDARAQESRP